MELTKHPSQLAATLLIFTICFAACSPASETNGTCSKNIDEVVIPKTVAEYDAAIILAHDRERVGGKTIGIQMSPGLQKQLIARNPPSITDNRTVELRFNKASVPMIIQYFETLGLNITTEKNINALITLRTEKELTIPEAILLLETTLRDNGIEMVRIDEKNAVLRRIEPKK